MPSIRQTTRFLREFASNPVHTGAVAPSSRFLARRMLSGLDLENARTVVEYGPGTGSFTRFLQPRLDGETRFFAVELNPNFAESFRRHHPDLVLHQDSVANIRAICDREGVDEICCIVSGLPWAAFPDALQTEILDATMTVLRPGGQFVTFAYLHGLLLPAARRFREKLDHYFSRVEAGRPVWLNAPPALCYTCTR